jgi:hypothetical protein
MLVLDYNNIIKHLYNDVYASRKNFRRLTWLHLFQFLKKKAIDQLNKSLSAQLIHSRGFVSEFNDRFKDEAQIDLSYPIKLFQDLLNINIKLKAELESSNDPQLQEADTILTETIEHYYTSLRILKRLNKRESIPTSQMATDSCRHSLNTLQAVINCRRTT